MLVYSTLMFHDVESHVKIGAIQSLLARQIFSAVDIFLIHTTAGPGGPAVRASASHREGPEFCPQPVYKRHCAENFRLNHRVPRVHWNRRARKICGVQSPDGACVRCRRWVRAQVSTSSLDRGSKLRGVIDRVKAPHGG